MEYHDISPMDHSVLERLFESGNETAIVDALLSAAFCDPDWRWVQSMCLQFLDHPGVDVRWNAATCLGHIARIHRKLDTEIVVPKLIALQGDAAVAPNVEDVLDDIRWFLRSQ